MKAERLRGRFVCCFIFASCLFLPAAAGGATPRWGTLPTHFTPNRGQRRADVAFVASGRGYELLLANHTARLNLVPNWQHSTGISVEMNLLGTVPEPQMSGSEELSSKINYYIGNERAHWLNGLPTFGKVRAAGVYPGIDLVYYGVDGELEYDFILRPGTDPGQIALQFKGPETVTLGAEGDLVMTFPTGEVRHKRPVAYQEVNGIREPVECRFQIGCEGVIRFVVARYDTTRTLVIDPKLMYSTYFGSSTEETVGGVAVDASGHFYLVGSTGTSDDFPFAAAYQTSKPSSTAPAAKNQNAYVMQLAPDGSLVYATYLGGAENDYGYAIAVDSAGNAYVTGETFSRNPANVGGLAFPTTDGAYQTNNLFGDRAAFVTKLGPTGSLAYSTYLNAATRNQVPSITSATGYGIAVDAQGFAYVTGTINATILAIAKLNQVGTALLYQKQIVGAVGRAVAVDDLGAAYVVGGIQLNNVTFPMTPSALFTNHSDSFFLKLAPDGDHVPYATAIAPRNRPLALAVAVDGARMAYVAGSVDAPDQFPGFPLKKSFQPQFGGGVSDGFVMKFDLTQSGTNSLTYSTYLGGTNRDVVTSLNVDPIGRLYVAGFTGSTNFPVANPTQTNYAGGATDAFVAELNAAGTGLIFSTFLGGSGDDAAYGVAAPFGGTDVFVGGVTRSADFPTLNAVQPTLRGSQPDAFAARIQLAEPAATFIVNSANDLDDGQCDTPHCSLREAINAVNKSTSKETVFFQIPSAGIPSIKLTSPLPAITKPVILDGTSQSAQKVEIDGTQIGQNASGLHVTGGDSVIKGFVINHFQGDGILIESGGNNSIQGNLIGKDTSGNVRAANTGAGVHILNSSGNTVGDAQQNILSGNTEGIVIEGATSRGNIIVANLIGVAQNESAMGNLLNGLRIKDAAGNTIGMTPPKGNLISANRDGIRILGQGASNNIVQGNTIGTTSSKVPGLGQANGIVIESAPGTRIGGPFTEGALRPGNIVSGNRENGIWISGATASGNRIEGNVIGVEPLAPPNGVGLFIQNAPSNVVGGAEIRLGNEIQRSTSDGVRIEGETARGNHLEANAVHDNGGDGVAVIDAPATEVSGFLPSLFDETLTSENTVELNAKNGISVRGPRSAGTVIRGNTLRENKENGIALQDTSNVLVGGETEWQRLNIVLKSGKNGIFISGGSDNQVHGNYIGVSIADDPLGNAENGVLIENSARNQVGGPLGAPFDPPGNMIGGNRGDGVKITGASSVENRVEGNLVGVSLSNRGLPNVNGVTVTGGAPRNIVGGDRAELRNIISGNIAKGVLISGFSTGDNLVQGNWIGLGLNGANSVPNEVGIEIDRASDNRIGDSASAPGQAPGNVISGNRGFGVHLQGPDLFSTRVQGNLIGPSAEGALLMTADFKSGNGAGGISISSAEQTLIGGDRIALRNVISGNDGPGVAMQSILGSGLARNNVVQGNIIGTDGVGLKALPNTKDGVSIERYKRSSAGPPARAVLRQEI